MTSEHPHIAAQLNAQEADYQDALQKALPQNAASIQSRRAQMLASIEELDEEAAGLRKIVRDWNQIKRERQIFTDQINAVASEIAQAEQWITERKAAYVDSIGATGEAGRAFSAQKAAEDILAVENSLPMMRDGLKELNRRLDAHVEKMRVFAKANDVKEAV